MAIEILEVVLRAYLKMRVSSDGIHPHVTFDVMLESDVRLSSGCRRYRSYAFRDMGMRYMGLICFRITFVAFYHIFLKTTRIIVTCGRMN